MKDDKYRRRRDTLMKENVEKISEMVETFTLAEIQPIAEKLKGFIIHCKPYDKKQEPFTSTAKLSNSAMLNDRRLTVIVDQ